MKVANYVLHYHPYVGNEVYFVSLLFAILISLHLVLFLVLVTF